MSLNRGLHTDSFCLVQRIHEYNLSIQSREIFLHGYVDNVEEEPGIDYRCATRFIKNLNLLNRLNNKPIIVHMHSIGGEWADGMAIFDAIKHSTSPIIIIAYAHARSMTSIILQAADLRLMMPHSDFLIHYGYAGYEGNARSFESEADWNKHLTDVMLDIYVERCQHGEYYEKNSKKPHLIRKNLMQNMDSKQEFYMTAEEAVNRGFADGVIGIHYDLEDVMKNNVEIPIVE